jgi:hypothetical protein
MHTKFGTADLRVVFEAPACVSDLSLRFRMYGENPSVALSLRAVTLDLIHELSSWQTVRAPIRI